MLTPPDPASQTMHCEPTQAVSHLFINFPLAKLVRRSVTSLCHWEETGGSPLIFNLHEELFFKKTKQRKLVGPKEQVCFCPRHVRCLTTENVFFIRTLTRRAARCYSVSSSTVFDMYRLYSVKYFILYLQSPSPWLQDFCFFFFVSLYMLRFLLKLHLRPVSLLKVVITDQLPQTWLLLLLLDLKHGLPHAAFLFICLFLASLLCAHRNTSINFHGAICCLKI